MRYKQNSQVACKKKYNDRVKTMSTKAQWQNNHSPTQPPTTMIQTWNIELVNATNVRKKYTKEREKKYFHQRLQLTYTAKKNVCVNPHSEIKFHFSQTCY